MTFTINLEGGKPRLSRTHPISEAPQNFREMVGSYHSRVESAKAMDARDNARERVSGACNAGSATDEKLSGNCAADEMAVGAC